MFVAKSDPFLHFDKIPRIKTFDIYLKKCKYNQEISLKKTYDEVTKDIFDMSNVRNFKEIEKKKMRDVYTLLCLSSVELSKAFGLRNLCYSKISVVMLLG